MSDADLLAEILRLPAEERARLALELIRSLEAEAGAADAWDAEIARSRCGGGRRHRADDDGRRIPSARATAQSRTRASMNLRIHQLAVAEIDREVDYYESRQSGLGTELEDEIEAVFSLILNRARCSPDSWDERARQSR
jgi:hypothetical protein